MISEAEIRWGPLVRAFEGVARVVVRWTVLLTFVVMAWYAGASSEATANAQVVYEARIGQHAGQACAATLDSVLRAGEEAGTAVSRASLAQRWVLASRGVAVADGGGR